MAKNIPFTREELHSVASLSEGSELAEEEEADGHHGAVGEEREADGDEERDDDNIYNDTALDESISFFRIKNRYDFDSDESRNVTYTQQEIDEELGIPEGWTEEDPKLFVYIDDANSIEKVRIPGSVVEISQNKQICKVHAQNQKTYLMQYLSGLLI